MFLDAATLRDLEVFSPLTPQGPTIWSLLDRTHTRAGKRALRDRLVESPDTAVDIVERQRAHQEVIGDERIICDAVARAGCDRVEHYLNLTWQLPEDMRGPGRLIGHVWPRWYRHYLKEARRGRQDVLAFLDAAAQLGRHLRAARAASLRQAGQEFATVLELPEACELLRLGGKRSTGALVSFDQLARGRAKAMLVDVLARVGSIEAMWSIAAATVEHGWSYPTPGPQFSVRGLRHPFLGRLGIPNDLHLEGEVRVCFITGPNMAGKSTFLKTVASSMMLAHAGCGVPASSMTFPVVGAVFSSVQIMENFNGGESFYLAEVRRIKALAAVLQDSAATFAVVDEPFRGTNVHDAAEATLAVIERLLTQPCALVFIASHIAEVTPRITLDGRIRLLHFAANTETGRPAFDFRLRDGVSTQRLGMTLLKQERVLDLLGEGA